MNIYQELENRFVKKLPNADIFVFTGFSYINKNNKRAVAPRLVKIDGKWCFYSKSEKEQGREKYITLDNFVKMYQSRQIDRVSGYILDGQNTPTSISFSNDAALKISEEFAPYILSGLNRSVESLVSTPEALNGVEPANEPDEENRGAQPDSKLTISEGDQKGLETDTASLSTSEREAVVKIRFGQGAFRSSLLDIAGEICWMSGIEGKEFLIASHIQPWAHSDKNPEARGRTNNGLLLSSLWDAAFDSGLVTFDEEWRVVMSPKLSDSAKKHLGLEQEMFLPEKFRNFSRSQYMAYHRMVIFKQ